MATYIQNDRGEPQGNTPTQNTKYDDLIAKSPWTLLQPPTTVVTTTEAAPPTTKTTITIG